MAKISGNKGGFSLNLNDLPKTYAMLEKDKKLICRIVCDNPPLEFPFVWRIKEILRTTKISVSDLPQFSIFRSPENSYQKNEWDLFLGFLRKNNRVALVNSIDCDLYLFPPDAGKGSDPAVVRYRVREHVASDSSSNESNGKAIPKSSLHSNAKAIHKSSHHSLQGECVTARCTSEVHTPSPVGEGFTRSLHKNVQGRDPLQKRSSICVGKDSHSNHIPPQTSGDPSVVEAGKQVLCRSHTLIAQRDDFAHKSSVRSDPSYLQTLGESHAGWVFGAIAEIVDNSRDAKATRLDIAIETLYSRKAGEMIPVLSFVDDGCGMSHNEVIRMLTFGHKQPEGDDPSHIGRFGIGFKTGSMRLGRDAIVLTQSLNSRSIAFLSQSFNADKSNIEIPIVSYRRVGSFMEVDSSIHSEAEAKAYLKAIKEFSPFNEYFIGEKSGLFGEMDTGTQIYIWDLAKWGSGFIFEWTGQCKNNGSSQSCQGDILIRSRRIRSRPGQISKEVPLDYSLQNYLEVVFLDPRMKIYVQGSLVKSRPLAKSLSKTVIVNGAVMGKAVQLTLGRSRVEWDRLNCGMFLYWHGRLIEAYKRVGGMVHNADMGRGVIGVIDVTDIMKDENNQVKVLNTKQGFQDCEEYAELEDWLGHCADEYWDANFDNLELKKGNARFKPDHEWVQCNKCRKWRILSDDFDNKSLPQMWFCQMPPFSGTCSMPEQKVEHGVITVGAKRSGCDPKAVIVKYEENQQKVIGNTVRGDSSGEESSQTIEDQIVRPVLKRLRRGPPRGIKSKKP